MATVRDVAKLAKVSPSTISKFLNKSGYVAPNTRTRIENAITELNYHTNRAARRLRTALPDQIAVVVPNLEDKLYNRIFVSIQNVFATTRYCAIVHTTGDGVADERAIIDKLCQGDYAGAIICACDVDNTALFEQLLSVCPVVFLLRMPKVKNVNFIGFDQMTTVFNITNTLLQSGTEDIALYTEKTEYSCEQECVNGFEAAFRRNGIPTPACGIYSYPFSKENAYRIVMRIFDQKTYPKVFLTSGRGIAKVIADVALLRGIHVGKEMFVITLGEDSWYDSLFFQTIISTFRPAHTVGEKAAEALMANIASPMAFERVMLRLKDEFPSDRITEYTDALSKNAPAIKLGGRAIRLMFPTHKFGFQALKCLCAQFKNQYGIEVVPQASCYKDIYAEYKRMMENKTAEYALLPLDIMWLPYFAYSGLLKDLSNVSVVGASLSLRCVPGFFEASSVYRQRVYGFPFSYDTEILFYRKDLFDDPAVRSDFYSQYKIPLDVPKDWFSFNLVAKFFTRRFNPNSPTEFGTSVLVSDSVSAGINARMWAYGAEVFDRRGRVCFYSDATVKAYTNLLETLSCCNMSVQSSINDIIGGNVAMMVTFNANAPEIINWAHSISPSIISYAPIPSKCGEICGWTMAVNRYSDQQDDAVEFVKWFSRDETAMTFTVLGGNTAQESIYRFAEIKRTLPWMSLSFDMFPYCRPRSSIIRPDAPPLEAMSIETILTDVVKEHLQTDEPLRSCIRRAHERLSAYFAQNGFEQTDMPD